MPMLEFLFIFLQTLTLLALAPLIIGVIRKTKAVLQSRKGPPLLQPYYDLIKLFHKGSVISKDASWMTTIAPLACLISMVVAALLVPAFLTTTAGFMGDLIVLVYLFANMRFFMALAALDAGSTFGGMGSSREMMVSALIEPAILLAFFSIALLTGTTSLSIASGLIVDSGAELIGPTLILAFSAFIIALLAENSRIPFDNPATHLELTMTHEGMLLEYSGRDLALMEYASMIKLMLFMTIAWNAFLPWGIATELRMGSLLIGAGLFLLKVFLLAVIIALIESSMAKMRLFRQPSLLAGAFVLAFLAVVSYFVLEAM
ncbi:MAG: NADH-quinone oxidoreductase subunit H [Methanomassiliicoccales archaeon]